MQNFDHNIEKNANFFAENCRKSQKIVIISSTPDRKNLTIFSSLCKRPLPNKSSDWWSSELSNFNRPEAIFISSCKRVLTKCFQESQPTLQRPELVWEADQRVLRRLGAVRLQVAAVFTNR
jgi:hypothetical protein